MEINWVGSETPYAAVYQKYGVFASLRASAGLGFTWLRAVSFLNLSDVHT